MTLLQVDNLSVRFETPHGAVQALDGLGFELEEGETLGMVGESGSGKSVSLLALLGLVPTPPGLVSARRIRYGKLDLASMGPRELRRVRGREIAMVFQDPMSSLNPYLSIGRQLGEVLEVHEKATRRLARSSAAAALDEVGLPASLLDAYPHQLSGGQRQRAMIAMALLCRPAILLADEPTTALDVTVQAQILELLRELQERRGMSIVLITHDLSILARVAERVLVLYAGRAVESAPMRTLFAHPVHPYTQGLLASVPTLAGEPGAKLVTIEGQPPDLIDLPPGCAFAPRCAHVKKRCLGRRPLLELVGGEHESACFENKALTGNEVR